MKKQYIIPLLLLFFISIETNAQEQDPRWELTQPIEAEIEAYINNNINDFELSQEDTLSIQNIKNQTCSSTINVNNYKEIIKRDRLRWQYFQKNPENAKMYKSGFNSNTKNLQDNCINEGFEEGSIDYDFFTRVDWNHPGGINVNLGGTINTSLFTPHVPDDTDLNNYQNNVSLVSEGFDPILESFGIELPRVLNGNRAIRLNPRNGWGEPLNDIEDQEDATILTKVFNSINQDFISLNFAAIFDIHGLPANDNSFVRFEAYDNDLNKIVASKVINSLNSQACLIDVPNSTWRYIDWSCISLDVRESMGHNVTLRVIVSDCTAEVHDGIIYLDDICNNGNVCIDSTFGNLYIDPVNIVCPETPFQVCGSYNIPSCFPYNSDDLWLTIWGVRDGFPWFLSNTPIVDYDNATFCFTINPSDIISPSGNYEIQVEIVFGHVSESEQVVIDGYSPNLGPDVSFENCDCNKTAGEDVTISMCINDNTDYDLNTFLVNADSGGTWSNGDGLFNPSTDIDPNFMLATVIYTIHYSVGDCDDDTAILSINGEDCPSPCDQIETITESTVNGTILSWPDIADSYTLEFISDSNCCPLSNTSPSSAITYENITDNFINLSQVNGALESKCFRWHIKTECSDWSDWCCIDTTGSSMPEWGNPYDECFPSLDCENYEEIILVSDDDNILTGLVTNYDTYSSIIASNIIESEATSLYQANESIRLLPGFSAQDESNFVAKIEECVFILNPPTQSQRKSSEIILDDLMIYPNPVENELILVSNENKLSQFQLYDIQGKLLISNSINNNKQIINVQNLPDGLYILKVTLENNEVIHKKIIKK